MKRTSILVASLLLAAVAACNSSGGGGGSGGSGGVTSVTTGSTSSTSGSTSSTSGTTVCTAYQGAGCTPGTMTPCVLGSGGTGPGTSPCALMPGETCTTFWNGCDGSSSSSGGGGDAGICPDWFGNMKGGVCTVPQGTECGGNTGNSYTFLSCCGGHWLESPDGGPPCP